MDPAIINDPAHRVADSGSTGKGERPDALLAVQLELALDTSDIQSMGFAEAVRVAVQSLDGEFLFDLPASGLVENCQRIAVVRIQNDGRDDLLMVMLDDSGEHITIGEPGEKMAGLAGFARAFVGVLERL